MAARWWTRNAATAQPPNIASIRPSSQQTLQPSLFSFPVAPSCTLAGHQGCVNALTWTPDGLTLLSGSDDRHIGVWSVSTAFEEKSRETPLSGAVLRNPKGMRTTVHQSNIFDIAVPMVSTSLECVSVALGGTVATCHIERGDSQLVSSDDEATLLGEGRGRRCEFLHGSVSAFIASVGSTLRLFDLRAPGYLVGVVCSGKTFALAQQSKVYLATSDDKGMCCFDLRALPSRDNYRAQQPGNASRHPSITGIDVTLDGSTVAVSCMGGGISVFPSDDVPMEALHPIPVVGTFHEHRNVDTFLKRPAWMYFNNEAWVAHGDDGGSAFLYEVPNFVRPDVWSSDTMEVRSAAMEIARRHGSVTFALPPATQADCGTAGEGGCSQRHTSRKVDSHICNVVAPHPTMRTRTPSVHPGVGIIAASGLDSTITLVHVEGDNHPRLASGFMPMKGLMGAQAIVAAERHEDSSGVADGTVGRRTLMNAAILKAKVNELFASKRLVLAFELYTQLGCAVFQEAQSMGLSDGSKALICSLWGNAALAASRLSFHRHVIEVCDAIGALDAKQPKALYRRACALQALGDYEAACVNARMASTLTNGGDAAVEALVKSLENDVAAAVAKERRRYAKMFA